VAKAIQREFDQAFITPNVRHMDIDAENLADSLNASRVHVLLHPSAIRTAPALDEIQGDPDTSDAYEQDILTVPASLAGLPAISIPSGMGDRGPLGISAVGQWGQDSMLLDVAELIEDRLNFEKPKD
jgi:aspartyl-tRNA(Asn)/glutamyl-tRNA(Gln) amidotransferase subunit A